MFNWFWKLIYGLLKAPLYCIDFILDFAKLLAGIKPITLGDGSQYPDLTMYFLQSDEIRMAFSLVAMVGVVLIFLFSAFAVLRTIGQMGGEKTPLSVCNTLMKTMLYLLLVPVIMVLGSYFISTIMTAVNGATSLGSASLGRSIFVLISEEAYDGDPAEKARIINEFMTGKLDYYSTSVVDSYFDLSDLNYFIGFVGGIATLIMLIKPLLTFVERTVSLILLFVVAPLSVSTVPLDDGVRFKLWRDQVLNKFLTAYGALIALNLFALMLGVVNDIRFFQSNFLNGLAQLFFVIGGALATNMGVVVFGNLVNSGAGSQHAMDNAHMAAGMVGIGHMAAGMARRGGGAILSSQLGRAVSDRAHSGVARLKSGVSRLGSTAYNNTLARPMSRAYGATIGKAKTAAQGIKDRASNWWDRVEGNASRRAAGESVAHGSSFRTVSSGGGRNDDQAPQAANKQSASTVLAAMDKATGNKGGSDGKK